MGVRRMKVFSLRDLSVGEYGKFTTSFTTIHATAIRERVDATCAERRLCSNNGGAGRGE